MAPLSFLVSLLCSLLMRHVATATEPAARSSCSGDRPGLRLACGDDASSQLQVSVEPLEARPLPPEQTTDRVVLEPRTGDGGPTLLVGTVMVKDSQGRFSPEKEDQPDWVQQIWSHNQGIFRKFGHGLIYRESKEPLELEPWQREVCNAKDNGGDEKRCTRNYLRENANWQKESMMAKYLQEPGITHVAIIDMDIVLTQTEYDTLGRLARELDDSGMDMVLTDEDWRLNGVGHVNGGFLLAKATTFSQQFFRSMASAHEEGPARSYHKCVSNEQLCLQGWISDVATLEKRVLLKSGSQYNCHPKVLEVDESKLAGSGKRSVKDHTLHAIHFMGSAKAAAPMYLSALHTGTVMVLREPSAVSMTCNDGFSPSPCFSTEECLAAPPPPGSSKKEKFAFVLSHSLEAPLTLPLPYISALKYEASKHNMDILLLVPRRGKSPLGPERRNELAEEGIKVVEVPWAKPPGMLFRPKEPNCLRKDLIRIHLFNLTDYDAVAYVDTDVEIQGDIYPALQCAARGYLLTTSGLLSPLNLGFIATRTGPELAAAALDFLKNANFSRYEGWNGTGFSPMKRSYPGAMCGQGLFHTLFYKQPPAAIAAMQRAGARIVAKQLDRCEWNYQKACPTPGFRCSSVRAHHKGGGAGCWKFDSNPSLYEFVSHPPALAATR